MTKTLISWAFPAGKIILSHQTFTIFILILPVKHIIYKGYLFYFTYNGNRAVLKKTGAIISPSAG